MKFKGIILTIICWGVISVNLIGQSITSTARSNTEYKFEIFNLPDPDPNAVPGPSNYPDRHYRIFYSFGDGQYVTSMSDMNQFHPPTSASINNACTNEYLYLGSVVNYSPLALLFDRKTNNPPPPSMTYTMFPSVPGVTVDIDGEAIPAPDPIHYAMPIIDMSDSPSFCRRVGVDQTPFLEDERWSSFILGYRPPDEGILLFFYKNIFLEDSIQVHRPQYGNYQSTETISVLPASTFIRSSPNFNKPIFDSVLIYPINQAESSLDVAGDYILNGNPTPEELRVFELFKTDSLTQDSFMFMSVLLKRSYEREIVGECTTSNWGEDSSYAYNYITDPEDPLLFNNIAYSYVDADTIKLKNGDPKDPNSLVITDICDCGGGDYRVTFRLRFCNENPYPTESAFIYIRDLTPNKLCRLQTKSI